MRSSRREGNGSRPTSAARPRRRQAAPARWRILIGEPAAAPVEALLRRADAQARLSSVHEAEVFDVMVRLRARTVDEVVEKLEWLVAGGLRLLGVSEPIAREAGAIRAAHDHRERRPVSVADCVALATARLVGDDIATSDPPLAGVATVIGVRVVGLSDARGRVP